MIIPQYQILPSHIPNAGQGLFLAQPIKKGSVITAPDKIEQVYTEDELQQQTSAAHSKAAESSVRWFENYCTISLDWPDECFINHSFSPTALWHLGFTFALQDYPAGTEITIDYRFLLLENQSPGFDDALTGEPILGLAWRENLRTSTEQLQQLLN